MNLSLRFPATDAQLLKRLRARDRNAFETVVTTHYETLYRQLWHLCEDRDLAADLTQETFIEAWRSLPTFEGRSSLHTWLHTLAVRVWYRSRRHRAVRPIETPLAEALVAALEEGETLNPVSGAERSARRALLDAAIAELPPAYRDAIRLFYRDELKYREIAESEQIPIGTVKSRLNGALRRLRDRLTGHEEELL